MSLLDTALEGLAEAAQEYEPNERIPRTLPLDVMEAFHRCEVERRGRQMMTAHLTHIGKDVHPRMESLGDMIEFGKAVKDNMMYLREVFQTLEERNEAEGREMPSPVEGVGKIADVDDETFKRFSMGAIVGVVHTVKRLDIISMKALYGATLSDIWQTVEACFGAIKRLEAWDEPTDPLQQAHFGLYDLTADGARDEKDVEYWRDRLVYALGARTTYFDNVFEKLDEVVDRIHEEERKAVEQARQKLGGLISLLGGDIGAGVIQPAGMGDIPPPPPGTEPH